MKKKSELQSSVGRNELKNSGRQKNTRKIANIGVFNSTQADEKLNIFFFLILQIYFMRLLILLNGSVE